MAIRTVSAFYVGCAEVEWAAEESTRLRIPSFANFGHHNRRTPLARFPSFITADF
jgi:hypothetical protein